MTTAIEQKIQELDHYFASKRTDEILIKRIKGRIIRGDAPTDIYAQIEEPERLATTREVMELRVAAFQHLQEVLVREEGPCLNFDMMKQHYFNAVQREFDAYPEIYGIWKERLTTATQIIRADDIDGKDTIFFYTGEAMTYAEIRKAIQGELSDGGFLYSEIALERVQRETPLKARLLYEEYKTAKGGNFSGQEWLYHPIFQRACGDEALMQEYVFALQWLDLFEFYNQGMHAGWRPGEMQKNFGRPIALGFKGEAFYPPNNTTRGHAALVIERDKTPEKILTFK